MNKRRYYAHKEKAINNAHINKQNEERQPEIRDQTVHEHRPKSSSSLSRQKILIVIIIVMSIAVVGVFISSFENLPIEIRNIHVSSEIIFSGDLLEITLDVNKIVPSYLEDMLNYLYDHEEEMSIKINDEIVLKDKVNIKYNENVTLIYSILEKEPGKHTINVDNLMAEFEVLKIARFEGSSIILLDYWLDEPANVSIDIKNIGGVVDTKFLFCYLDEKEIGKKQVKLGPEKNTTITFFFIANDRGTHKITFEMENHSNLVKEFEVKRVRFEGERIEITPNILWIGENMSVSMKITNMDEVRDTKTVVCYIDNEEIIQNNISLNPYQSSNISFFRDNVTAGQYDISIFWDIGDEKTIISKTIRVRIPDNPTRRSEYYYHFAEDYVSDNYVVPEVKNIDGLIFFLDQLEFPEYREGVFDCSESSSLLEWLLEGAGFHAYIARKSDSYTGHAWVQVEVGEDIVALEATQLTMGWSDGDSTKPWGIVSKSDGTYLEYTYQYRSEYRMFIDWKDKYASSSFVWDRNISFREWVSEYLSYTPSFISIGSVVPDEAEYYERFRGYESPVPSVEDNVRIFSEMEYDWWGSEPYSTLFPFSEW